MIGPKMISKLLEILQRTAAPLYPQTNRQTLSGVIKINIILKKPTAWPSGAAVAQLLPHNPRICPDLGCWTCEICTFFLWPRTFLPIMLEGPFTCRFNSPNYTNLHIFGCLRRSNKAQLLNMGKKHLMYIVIFCIQCWIHQFHHSISASSNPSIFISLRPLFSPPPAPTFGNSIHSLQFVPPIKHTFE